MSALSKKLRSFKNADGSRAGIAHWCPGCESAHQIWTTNVGGPVWSWNGDVDRPTVTPSVRLFHTNDEDERGNKLPQPVDHTLCHYVLTDGVINYCNDCGDHALGGQQVPLPDFPSHWGGFED